MEWIMQVSMAVKYQKLIVTGRVPWNASIDEKTPAFAEVYSWWGAVVEEVRTVFERRDDATIYIPDVEAISINLS